MELSEYLNFIESRIYRDEWRVGWFQSRRDVSVGDFVCKLVMYGHSRHFRYARPFFFSRFFSLRIIPYGTAAMVFSVEYLDISTIERIISSVKEFMKSETFITPEKVKWGIDVAYVCITSSIMGRGVKDYVEEIFRCDVENQYMQYEGYRGRIPKKIGLVVVNLSNGSIYCGRDMFSREAKRLFNPKLTVTERIVRKLSKLKRW